MFQRKIGQLYMRPLVSVVIPTKDRWKYLERAIASVLNQTVAPAEIIVVDDASSEDDGARIQGIFGSQIRLLRHDISQGGPAARNTGWKAVKHTFVAFLDDDDLWLPDKLERQLSLMNLEDKQVVDLVFCGEALVSNDKIVRTLPANWRADSAQEMLFRNVVGGTSTSLVRKDCLIDCGGFDVALPSCQDWDLWLRISRKYRVDCVPSILVHRTIHGEQISSTLERRISGRKLFLQKHWKLLADNPEALTQHQRRIGCLLALTGQYKEAKNFFTCALRNRPNSLNTWVCFLVFFLLRGSFRNKILSIYAVSKFGNIKIYH